MLFIIIIRQATNNSRHVHYRHENYVIMNLGLETQVLRSRLNYLEKIMWQFTNGSKNLNFVLGKQSTTNDKPSLGYKSMCKVNVSFYNMIHFDYYAKLQ